MNDLQLHMADKWLTLTEHTLGEVIDNAHKVKTTIARVREAVVEPSSTDTIRTLLGDVIAFYTLCSQWMDATGVNLQSCATTTRDGLVELE